MTNTLTLHTHTHRERETDRETNIHAIKETKKHTNKSNQTETQISHIQIHKEKYTNKQILTHIDTHTYHFT